MDKRGLGKGLNALLADQRSGDDARSVREIPIDLIAPNPYQPRTVFDEGLLQELADSIKEHGVLQPVLVRRQGADRYELIVGERRLRAARMVGLTSLPAVLRECSDRDMILVALIENVQRTDVSPLEQARAYRRMVTEFSLTQEEVARRVGKSRAAVGNTMRLLSLQEPAMRALEEGRISEGHARLLVPLTGPIHDDVLDAFLQRDMSVREAEAMVRGLLRGFPRPDPSDSRIGEERDSNHLAIEEALSLALGTRVRLRRTGEDRGYLMVEYYTQEQLEGLIDRFAGL